MFVKDEAAVQGQSDLRVSVPLVESVRVDGTDSHRILFQAGWGLGVAWVGELDDRIIAALTAYAERRCLDVDELAAGQAPAIGTFATLKAWWDKLDVDRLFDQIEAASVITHIHAGARNGIAVSVRYNLLPSLS